MKWPKTDEIFSFVTRGSPLTLDEVQPQVGPCLRKHDDSSQTRTSEPMLDGCVGAVRPLFDRTLATAEAERSVKTRLRSAKMVKS